METHHVISSDQMRLQNELMASYLKEKTGNDVSCL